MEAQKGTASDHSLDLLSLMSEHRSTANIFVTPYAVLTIISITNVCSQLIKDDNVCSSIRQVFADDVTFIIRTIEL